MKRFLLALALLAPEAATIGAPSRPGPKPVEKADQRAVDA
jgi:hypothetical protein